MTHFTEYVISNGAQNLWQLNSGALGAVWAVSNGAIVAYVKPDGTIGQAGANGTTVGYGAFFQGVCEGGDGFMYIGGGPGGGSGISQIWRLDPSTMTIASAIWGVNSWPVYPYSMFKGPDGNVWGFGYNTGYLFRLNISTYAMSVFKISNYGIMGGIGEMNLINDGTYIWTTDYNGSLWRVDTSGTPTQHVIAAGVALYAPSFDAAGNIWTGDAANNVYKISSTGTLLAIYANTPFGPGMLGKNDLIWYNSGGNNFTNSISSFDPINLVVSNYQVTGLAEDYLFNPILGADGHMWWLEYSNFFIFAKSVVGNPIVKII